MVVIDQTLITNCNKIDYNLTHANDVSNSIDDSVMQLAVAVTLYGKIY